MPLLLYIKISLLVGCTPRAVSTADVMSSGLSRLELGDYNFTTEKKACLQQTEGVEFDKDETLTRLSATYEKVLDVALWEM